MSLKITVLQALAKAGVNVAQFVGWKPDGKKLACLIRGVEPTYRFASIEEAIQALMDRGGLVRRKGEALPLVNIRTDLPNKHEGNDFLMGEKMQWQSVVEIADTVRTYLRRGLFVTVNENIPVRDGGVSGVVAGNRAEFAPCDTPRCVDKPGCAVMSRRLMDQVIQTVYGQRIGFPYSDDHRIEFTVSPGPIGYRRHRYVVWEESPLDGKVVPAPPQHRWPNRLSMTVGDKGYGLMMADLHRLPVPWSRVESRIIPPFEFGEPTGSSEQRVVRACPRLQSEDAGRFFTVFSWTDVPAEMQRQDPSGTLIASYLWQDHVDAKFSGKALTDAEGRPVIEGIHGRGDVFMAGSVSAEELPRYVTDRIRQLWEQAKSVFGPVQFEWAYDDRDRAWLVQLHAEAVLSSGDLIYPGEPASWQRFAVPGKLEDFRKFAIRAKQEGFGVILDGDIGITSHFGDILRANAIPSRIERRVS